ncbi:pentapeptide repeat-containing protein, partial [Paractinoplanes tereljensis]|uniref:pentapeptide repeat-containing protein n=1 Tax=Paractinoplanes tereljensis TaxID=571912 RepID=UPI0034DB6D74
MVPADGRQRAGHDAPDPGLLVRPAKVHSHHDLHRHQGLNCSRPPNVRATNVREANVRGANVRGANVRGANVRGANVRGANVRG